MMTSVQRDVVDYEDDDFDWEEAAREIDAACERASHIESSTLTSHPLMVDENDGNGLCFINNKKNPSFYKQSTLDKFTTNEIQASVVGRNEDGDSGNAGMGCVGIDPDAAKAWIYPVNIPLRDYQLAITKSALFSNTLVALPTGLGKTLIAAVVMYNYFRWFPDGKIVFAAPSRPLVMQQIEACHNIVGMPQEWTIDMTGQVSPTRRASFWRTKRVFFVTPQVLEKDIQSGTCSTRYLVCLVIDEAHRAMGNYSYCIAVQELLAAAVKLRILGLTATPGSKQQNIQHIIDNLHVSTLQYRDESDPDVSPYVHNRNIELIEVALGKDAIDVHKLLMDVICPFVAALSAVGLLQNKDCHALSPPDLLSSRDKFRSAPPPDLPSGKYGEIEGYFGCLITLYHIRKLLSSHGIRPAYEMLEEKLKQGAFVRYMSKNENIRRIKLLMQQSLASSAPSPKLSKLLEILINHFERRDPQKSRVIIFSHFRGSVRDIMSTLSGIGDLVKAAEFIGQSSGKFLKGQSQKVQQAVLQKFRDGGYNVIVATSIGEEGLDIMEVDLVICFDANISPVRMIQRMGRTGRKHDGRVVVLACEGSELKGYLRKQASSKTLRKRMRDGGINTFNFHPSPRMIPHIYKPEVRFVELSIKQYVPHWKKHKADEASHAAAGPKFKPSVEETSILAKYFTSGREIDWRPSLIAFPRFQALPSPALQVMHSSRTEMFVQTMQNLHEEDVSIDTKALFDEDQVCSNEFLLENNGEMEKEDGEATTPTRSRHASASPEGYQVDGATFDGTTPERHSPRGDDLKIYSGYDALDPSQAVPKTPILKMDLTNELGSVSNGELGNQHSRDIELSPRLTNLIQSGMVPESPIDEKGDCSLSRTDGFPSISQVSEKSRTPSSNAINTSCSMEWCLSSSEKLKNVERKHKLRRLVKLADMENRRCTRRSSRGNPGPLLNHGRSLACAMPRRIKNDKRELAREVKAFVEEEAEVSCGTELSNDEIKEEEEEENVTCNDSFIDDRINPSLAITQAEDGRCDMMAVYRRSLLSQSPWPAGSGHVAATPSDTPVGRALQAEGLIASSRTRNKGSESDPPLPSSTASYDPTVSRKRKLNFVVEPTKLEKEFALLRCSDSVGDEEAPLLCDDQFYASIDLDAVETQAATLLKTINPNATCQSVIAHSELPNSPTFHLGI